MPLVIVDPVNPDNNVAATTPRPTRMRSSGRPHALDRGTRGRNTPTTKGRAVDLEALLGPPFADDPTTTTTFTRTDAPLPRKRRSRPTCGSCELLRQPEPPTDRGMRGQEFVETLAGGYLATSSPAFRKRTGTGGLLRYRISSTAP